MKQETGRKLLSFLLTLAMVVGLFPGMGLTAYAANIAKYREYAWNETSKTLSYEDKDIPVGVTELATDTVAWTDGCWYIVPEGGITIGNRIAVTGTANLILRDGATLTASKGITVTGSNTLNIYAQSGGTGTLTATGDEYCAGIGGYYDDDGGHDGGTIVIHGGIIVANGGEYEGAGIGGSNGGTGGTVTIHGGKVTAQGSGKGAGIGGGESCTGGTLTINGGEVKATGGSVGGAGIGSASGVRNEGGRVTINGGTVTAIGGDYENCEAKAIGDGNGAEPTSEPSTTITIGSNVIVTAQERVDGNTLDITNGEPSTFGWVHTETHTHDDTTFTVWTDKLAYFQSNEGFTSENGLPTQPGNYVLIKDVTLSSTWNVPTGETNLCLNGHKITLITNANYAVRVGQGATLNLYDDEEESGAIVLDSGSESDSNYVGVYVDGGTFRMHGGTIRSFLRGVHLYDNSSAFTMTGGTIQNCEVCGVEADGTVTLTGGVIAGNGKGVTVSEDNVVFLSGAPTISGNGSEEKKENLMLYGGTVQVVGELTNTTPIGVRIEKEVQIAEFITNTVYTGTFTSGSTDSLKASDYAAMFASDNPAYDVLADGNELKLAQAPVPYMAWDETGKTVKNVEGGCTDYTVVTSGTTTLGYDKWYVVKNNVTIEERITVDEYSTANLILCDGATLTAGKGITVAGGSTLNIYGQSEGTGMLLATGATDETIYTAGIGGYSTYENGMRNNSFAAGTVTIHGGRVNANGGYDCAGIGGGSHADGGTVTIYGGEITAIGGGNNGVASGIGGGFLGKGGNVAIYGGAVMATGAYYNDNDTTFYTGMGIGGTEAIGAEPRAADNGSLTLGTGMYLYGGTSATPECDLSNHVAQSNGDYARSRYMTVNGVAPHTHNLTYYGDGAHIIATCSEEDCNLPKVAGIHAIMLTIIKPTLGTYGQTGDSVSAEATLTGLEAFNSATGKTIATTDIKYVGRDTTTYAESATAPTGAGKYTAKITVEEKTATVDYEIAKATIGTPAVTMAGYTYGETVSTPGIGAYSGEGAVTYYYNTANSTTGGTEWKDIAATTLAAGSYYMYAVIAETENYSGYTTATTSFTIAAPYSLYVGGTRVTSANADDVFGDGKASYNAESNTLTLNGYSNGEKFYKEAEAGVYNTDYRIAAGVYYAGAEKLTVALEGNNVLTMPEFSADKLDNAAFFSKGDVEFTSTGSLNATGGNASDNSEDSNVGSYGLCAIGENAAFTGSGAVTFTAGSGESSYGAYFGKETAVAFSGGTVTMTGGTSTGGSYGMYCGRVEVTGGEVQVTGGEAGIFSFGIYCWGDISVTGGTLTATGGSAANSSYGIRGIRETRCDIVVSGGTLNAVGGSAAKESCGIYSDWGGVDVRGGGTVTAEGGTVTGEGGKSCGISNGVHSINVKNGTLTAKGGSVTGSGGKSIGLYSSVGPIYFEEGASVRCLGGTVTGENGESFGISGFGSNIGGGNIEATGGNAAYSCGYYDKMALIVDAGTFMATGGEGDRSHGIFNRDYIEVNGGTVTAVGGSGSAESCGIYLAARQHSDETSKGTTLTVTGGEVSATGGSCGVFCDPATDGKVIVITGGMTTAAGNTAISRAPILGADVRASGSTSMDGSSPAEYSEASNDTYKWFKTETVAGEKTPITAVAFTVEEPVAGAEPAETVQVAAVPEGALAITEYKAVWLEADDSFNFVPMTSKLFEAGKRYAVEAPNEKNAGAPLIALTKPGYVLPIEYEKEPVYTLNGEDTFMVTPYFDYFGPLEEVEYGVSVSPAELRFSAYTGYSEEDSALYREITASNTGNGKVEFILAGFTESSMYEQFGLIVGGMTATVYPKEGLAEGTYRATVRIEDWYDRFDTIEVPVTFTVYTRSTAPGTPAAETVTIPVSGDDETVNVTVRVSGDTATITGANVEKVLEAEDVGTVTIDVSALKQNVSVVVIPAAMVNKIADAVADESNNADGLEIKLPTGSVTFDADALATITEQADGKDLTLHLDDVKVTELASAQQEAVSELEIEVVLDAYLTSGGKRISDFNGGSATVKIPYTLKDGQTAQGLVVWYVATDGTRSQVPASYDGKNVVFTVPHFSNYVIAYDAEKAAACPKDDTCPISAFDDADPTAWYHDGVHFVLANGIMNGMGDGKFAPNDNTSRAMIVTILYRLEGSPAVTAANPFDDVAAGQWYADAVIWAAENKIVSGYGDGKFGPDDAITREQLAAILYRYAQTKGEGFKGLWSFKLDFPDAADVSDWATEAVCWMVMNGIINGKDSKLVPGGNASRAEAATMLQRICAKLAE